LTAKLFDSVPIDQMTDAEHALHEAAANIPAEVSARIDTAEKLSDKDRGTIIEIARHSLVRFQPQPGSKPEPNDKPISDVHPKPKPEPVTTPKRKAEAEEKS